MSVNLETLEIKSDKIIKNSQNKDTARQALIAKYAFDIEQTNAILDMRLSKLTKLETVDLQTEKGELLKEIEKQINIIKNTICHRSAGKTKKSPSTI